MKKASNNPYIGMKVWILLGILIIFASLSRCYKIRSLGTFRSDQAIELSGARDITRGKFMLIGIKTSNSNLHNGAVMYFLLAPFVYFFSGDPLAGGVLQSILSIGAVVVTYLIGYVTNKQRIGLVAASMIAMSSLLVRFSRQTLLAQYPLFFCALAMLLLVLLAWKYSYLKTLVLGILLGYMVQIHYATLAVVLMSCIFPFLFLPRTIWIRYALWLSIGYIIGFSPMILFEVRHQFFNTKMFIQLVTQHGSDSPTLSAFPMGIYWVSSIAKTFFGGFFWLTLGVLGWLSYAVWKRRTHLTIIEKVSLIQIIATLLFTVAFVRQDVVHYMMATFVPLALLVAVSSCELFGRGVAIALFFGFIALNVPAYGFAETHGWTMHEGWDVAGVQKAAALIRDDSRGEVFNVAMLVDGETQALPVRYFLEQDNIHALPVESYDKAHILYVVTEPGLDLEHIDVYEINAFGSHTVEKTWPIQHGFTLYRLGHRAL